MNIDISVIIPVYNPPHDKFERCIESLKKQMGVNLEFIFVNDGSTDAWIAERLERLKQEDCRVIYISKENEGVSVARNIGMETAKGEYIAFVDSDDYMLDGGLEYMYRETKRHGAEMGMFGYESEHFGGQSKVCFHEVIEGDKKKEIIREIIAEYGDTPYLDKGIFTTTPWAKLYRRNFIVKENIKFISGLNYGEDNLFILEASGKAEKIVIDNRKTYCYVYEKNSLSNRIIQRSVYNFIIVMENKKRLIEEMGYESKEIYEALHFMTFLYVLRLDFNYLCDTAQNIPLTQRHRDYCALLDEKIVASNIKNVSIGMLKKYTISSKSLLARLFIYKYKLVWILTVKTWIKQRLHCR